MKFQQKIKHFLSTLDHFRAIKIIVGCEPLSSRGGGVPDLSGSTTIKNDFYEFLAGKSRISSTKKNFFSVKNQLKQEFCVSIFSQILRHTLWDSKKAISCNCNCDGPLPVNERCLVAVVEGALGPL